jgi:hypothetical protein
MPPKKKPSSRNESKDSKKSKGKKSNKAGESQAEISGSKGKTDRTIKTKTAKNEEEEQEEGNEEPLEEGGEGEGTEEKTKRTENKSKNGSKANITGKESLNKSKDSKKKNKTKSKEEITNKDDVSKNNLDDTKNQDTSALKNERLLPSKLEESVKRDHMTPRISNCLVVTLSNCEFSRDLNYFVALQLGKSGPKKRTEVSNNVHNPAFRTNTFTIPLEGQTIEQHQLLFFSAFIVLSVQDYSRELADEAHAGEARLLGECSLNLVPLRSQLYDPNGQGVKQSMKFVRRTGNMEGTVGRFVVNVKYIGEPKKEEVDPSLVESKILQEPGPEENDNMKYIVRPLPKSDGYLFHWRIRVDLRSAIDLMMNSTEPKSLPSTFFEIGITDQINQRPPDNVLQVTKTVPSERNPVWNQQLLMVRYQDENPSKQTYLYLALINNDRSDKKAFDAIWLPVHRMMPFFPYNFEFQSSTYEFKTRGIFWVSLVLEEKDPKKTLEQYADIVVHKAHHNPSPPENISRFMIAMTLYNYIPKELSFNKVDLEKVKVFDTLLEKLGKENSQRPLFLSTILKIPTDEVREVDQDRVILSRNRVILFAKFAVKGFEHPVFLGVLGLREPADGALHAVGVREPLARGQRGFGAAVLVSSVDQRGHEDHGHAAPRVGRRHPRRGPALQGQGRTRARLLPRTPGREAQRRPVRSGQKRRQELAPS